MDVGLQAIFLNSTLTCVILPRINSSSNARLFIDKVSDGCGVRSMSIRFAFAFALVVSTFVDVRAQENAKGQGFHGVAPPVLRSFNTTTEAEAVMQRIVAAVGLQAPRFQIVATASVNNAAAWIQGNQRIIGYNQAFMKDIYTSAGRNYFSQVGILAHEIGHHFLGHTVEDLSTAAGASSGETSGNSDVQRARSAVELPSGQVTGLSQRREDELAADHFSGFVLAKLGASREDSTAWLNSIPDPGPNSSHPRNDARRESIETGWRAAANQMVAPSQPIPQSTWNHNGSTMTLAVKSERRTFFYERPRQEIASRGVEKGTLLFDGRVSGNRIEGVIYAFSFNCGKFAYRVSGVVENDGRVISMTGSHPTINASCRVIRSNDEQLVFSRN